MWNLCEKNLWWLFFLYEFYVKILCDNMWGIIVCIYCIIIVYVYIFFVILVVYSGSGYDGFFGR